MKFLYRLRVVHGKLAHYKAIRKQKSDIKKVSEDYHDFVIEYSPKISAEKGLIIKGGLFSLALA